MGHEIKTDAMFREKFDGANFLLTQNGIDLFVHQARGVIAVLTTASHEVFAEENILLIVPSHRSDFVAHTPFAHHAASETSDDFEIV